MKVTPEMSQFLAQLKKDSATYSLAGAVVAAIEMYQAHPSMYERHPLLDSLAIAVEERRAKIAHIDGEAEAP